MNPIPQRRLQTLCLAFALLLPCLGSAAATEVRPNLIFLFADDLAAGAVGYAGNKDVLTPNIDRLAAEGIRFMNHYDTTSICMASRCTVLTGLYEYRHGCNFDHGDLERRFMEASYPVILREAGYYTGFAGKVGFVIQNEGFGVLRSFFDEWAGGPGQTAYETEKNEGIAKYAAEYPHCSRAYGAWARDFLRSAKQGNKPFCLSISFKAPHLPFTPDPIDMKLYEGKSFQRPSNYGTANAAHLSPQSRTSRAATGYREWVTDYDVTAAKYYALVTGVDAAVGMIRDELQRLGLNGNTVILFTSDNGYNAGAHGFGDKVLPYEEGSKAPLIIYDPRLPSEKQGRVCEAVTGNVDVAPTLLTLAGASVPDGIDGRDLTPLLADGDSKVRDYLPLFNFWGTASAQSMAVVSKEWKYIYWYYGDGMNPTEELFHLGNDPYEMVNEVGNADYARVLTAAREQYDHELSEVGTNVIASHGYEKYSKLFNRSVGWEQKAGSLRAMTKTTQGGDDDGKAVKNRKTKKQKASVPNVSQ